MNKVVVFAVFGAWGIPSVSPFVLKLETWLRIAGIPYERRAGNPMRAPKGKVPYVEIDGEPMGDSQLVIDRLTAQLGVNLDAHLTPAQRGTGHALRRMLEEATYFPLIRFRWVEEDGWPVQVAAFAPNLPPVIGTFVLRAIRSKLRKTIWLQGSGRHDRATAAAQVAADIQAIRDVFVGPFLFGAEPSSFDATVASFLWQGQGYPLDNPPRRAASAPELVSYVNHVRQRYWPELAQNQLMSAAT